MCDSVSYYIARTISYERIDILLTYEQTWTHVTPFDSATRVNDIQVQRKKGVELRKGRPKHGAGAGEGLRCAAAAPVVDYRVKGVGATNRKNDGQVASRYSSNLILGLFTPWQTSPVLSNLLTTDPLFYHCTDTV